ncbi:Neuropilin-1 [Holothuria leucospilota]|uniref:Neuropilin-1 n=1 Tax=Holothuria leucospilota TaxID=206669 RepID=A0A9Q0YJC3_HOLLE|nr:Neuropilin-1 [Holothuria leucospilota]
MHCVFLVNAPSSNVVVLQFYHFDIEISSSNDLCRDILEVYDDHPPLFPLIQIFCGSRIPQPIYSTGQKMTLIFQTNPSVTSTGFQARVLFLPISDLQLSKALDDTALTSSTLHPSDVSYAEDQVKFLLQGLKARRAAGMLQDRISYLRRCHSIAMDYTLGLFSTELNGNNAAISMVDMSSLHLLHLVYVFFQLEGVHRRFTIGRSSPSVYHRMLKETVASSLL